MVQPRKTRPCLTERLLMDIKNQIKQTNGLSPPVKVLFTDHSKVVLFCGSFLLVMLHVGVCCANVSVTCSRVVICWERADLLAVCRVCCVLSHSQMCPGQHLI